MEKRISLLVVVMALFVMYNGVNGKPEATENLSEIDRKLKLLNKPAVKSIKSEDGDIIDCVDIKKQPAFDHPALKNHTIKMMPSFDLPTTTSKTENDSSELVASQIWQRSGSCPDGTIPIRRIRREDLLRAQSFHRFGMKTPQTGNQERFVYINNTKVSVGKTLNRSSATLVTVGFNYIGAGGDINVWNPHVDSQDEFTTAQIWLKGGPGDNFESLESGWMVHPSLYGDSRTRLFAYWTVDAYKTGCFDLTCSGFVQTSNEIVLGAAIEPISSIAGEQYYISINIYLDTYYLVWWLKFGDKIIGYWPGNLFSYLKYSAILVEWGGEVYSQNVKGTKPHTKTEMGSGSFGLFGVGCFVRNIRIIDFSQSPKFPQWVGAAADEYDCYSAVNYIAGYTVEPVLYFGGPGQNPRCP